MERNLPCQIIGWNEIDALVSRLAQQMHAAGFRPDLIVAIARGGFVPARLLAQMEPTPRTAEEFNHRLKEEHGISFPLERLKELLSTP